VFAAMMLATTVVVTAAPAQAYPRPGGTERVSVGSDGTEANRDTFLTVPAVTPDGRYVAFGSAASSLMPAGGNENCTDGNGNFSTCPQVFVKDRRTGRLTIVSVSISGAPGNAASNGPSITPDGRFVAFSSTSSDLVQGDTNGRWDVFVHDRDADADGTFDEPGSVSTERVSVASDGSQAVHTYGEFAGYSRDASITPDGRYVSFTSGANNLVAGDTDHVDVFVHDRRSRKTVRVSVSSEGRQAPKWSSGLTVSTAAGVNTISADGRHVVFQSNVDVTRTSTSGFNGVFAHDRDADGNGVFDEPGGIRTVVVSKSSDGTRRDGSAGGSVSADGRFVTFQSDSTLLVPSDTNGNMDAFVHDRDLDGDGVFDQPGAFTTERVSVSSAGAQGTGNAFKPAIAAGGRHVVFMSSSSNLVAGDTNGRSDVFVHDRATRVTDRVSVASDGTQGNHHSPDYLFGAVNATPPAISADGRYAVFNSQASNLVADDTNNKADLFLRDRGPANGARSVTAARSGGTVAVTASATFTGVELAHSRDAGDDGLAGAREAGAELTGATVISRTEAEDVLVRLHVADLGLAMVAADSGSPGTVYGLELGVAGIRYEARATAASGRAPVFELYRCELVCTQVALLTGSYGTVGDEITLVVPHGVLDISEGSAVTGLRAYSAAAGSAGVVYDEVRLDDAVAPSRSAAVGLAPSGIPQDEVAFTDVTSSLSEGAFSGEIDVASRPDGLYEVWASACLASSCHATAVPLRIGAAPEPDPDPTPTPTPTATTTPAPEPTPGPEPEPQPVIDPRRERTSRVSETSSGVAADDYAYQPAISADGRHTAFVSSARNLVAGDTNRWCPELVVKSCPDIYVQDGATGIIRLVSVATDGTQANALSEHPAISADGRFVAFTSYASNLVPGDTNESPDIFVHDRDADEDGVYDERGAIRTERVSVASDGTQTARGESLVLRPSISADGRYVVFSSTSGRLVSGDTNGLSDVFLRDLVNKTTERVSISANNGQTNGHAAALGLPSAVSDGGRYVAFWSDASNIVAGDTNGKYDVFVRDRQESKTTRVSVASDGTQLGFGDGAAFSSLSADGRFVAFQTNAANLVPGDNNTTTDVFVRDRDSDGDGIFDEADAVATTRVSVASTGAEGTGGGASIPVLSAGGRYVAFESTMTNLVPGDTNASKDVFIHDRASGVTERISVASSGSQAARGGFWPSLSRDGRYAPFVSTSTDLVAGDTSGDYDDVFLRDLGPGVGVGRVTAAPDDAAERVDVSGWAGFRATTLARAADAADDGLPGAQESGAELTAATITYRGELDDLLVQLSVSHLPAVYPSNRINGGASGSSVAYGLEFEYRGVRFEVRALAPSGRTPLFELHRCDPVCVQQQTLSGGFGTTGDEITVSLPRQVLGAPAGAALAQLRAFTTDVASTGARIDELALSDVVIPTSTVQVGIAPAGSAEADVEFSTVATGTSPREFATAVDVSSLSAGRYEVWGRACLADTCGARRVPVQIGPAATTVQFTDRSMRTAQHSDIAVVEALLTDEHGAPLADAPVTFELAGAEGARTVAASTDRRGLAVAALTVRERPGEHQLTARYPGSGTAYGASAATAAFVVEHEATVLELTLTGKGSKRVLTAVLRDHDAAEGSPGLSGRTIHFRSDGKLLGEAVTDSDGVARFSPPSNAKGPFRATFAGDAWYVASSAAAG
jgi:Tol biopolymer transport system component